MSGTINLQKRCPICGAPTCEHDECMDTCEEHTPLEYDEMCKLRDSDRVAPTPKPGQEE